jgi:uncharacterized protein
MRLISDAFATPGRVPQRRRARSSLPPFPLSLLLAIGFAAGCGHAIRPNAVGRCPSHFVPISWKPLLWRIEGPKPSFLLAVAHNPRPEFAVLPKSVVEALKRVDRFSDELLDDPSAASLLARCCLPEGTTILSRIPQFVQSQLKSWAAAHDMNWERLIRLRPWLLAEVILRGGQSDRQGPGVIRLEEALKRLASSLGKRLTTLETAEDQLGPFDNLVLGQQLRLVELALDLADGSRKPSPLTSGGRFSEFASGDESIALRPLVATDLPERILLSATITQRNEGLAARILKQLEDGTSLFAVGAGHLGGEEGVIERLRRAGKVVTRVADAGSDCGIPSIQH